MSACYATEAVLQAECPCFIPEKINSKKALDREMTLNKIHLSKLTTRTPYDNSLKSFYLCYKIPFYQERVTYD